MNWYSRDLIEEYCRTHKSKKCSYLAYLVECSYDLGWEGTDADAIFLEQTIERERNPELKKALQDLDDFLFGW